MKVSILRVKFGLKIRSLRNAKKYSQEELAENTLLSVEYISKIERGLASPSFEVIAKLSRALSVSPVDLFDFSDLE